MPPARIVFEVCIEGSARKVITVRSSLLVDNQLEDPIEVKLETHSSPGNPGTDFGTYILINCVLNFFLKCIITCVFCYILLLDVLNFIVIRVRRLYNSLVCVIG